ncbi:MAG: hypothetical protein ACP5DZ_04195 [Bacteroidales bacterium]
MNNKITYLIISVLLILLSGNVFPQHHEKYLFVGHTYRDPYLIDTRLENLNTDIYKYIWLGGDICSDTFLDYQSLDYLQQHLNICGEHNYWSLGNHDARNGNIDWYIDFTGKKTYYADYFPNVSAFVFDTNLSPGDCENLDNQYRQFVNLCDTISQSSYLLLFFHWGLWYDVPGLPQPGHYCHSSQKYWNANCDSVNNNFVNSVYPHLIDVQNKGIEVICIMGDMGATYKSIDYVSDHGIRFLGCGLYNHLTANINERYAENNDRVLVFDHNIDADILTYEYQDLDSLLHVQDGWTYLTKHEFSYSDSYDSTNIVHEYADNYVYLLSPDDSLLVFDEEVNFQGTVEISFTLAVKAQGAFNGSLYAKFSYLDNNNNLVNEDFYPIENILDNEWQYNSHGFNVDGNNFTRMQCFLKSDLSTSVKLNDIVLKYK